MLLRCKIGSGGAWGVLWGRCHVLARLFTQADLSEFKKECVQKDDVMLPYGIKSTQVPKTPVHHPWEEGFQHGDYVSAGFPM